jgi:hypothetical protein
MNRNSSPSRRIHSQEAAHLWMRRARSARCVICGAQLPKGHHIITQQQLRRSAAECYEQVRWDLRNMLPLCEHDHAGHHSKMHPIPLSIVLYHRPEVVAFAKELELTWWLSREYPRRSR